MNSRERSIYPGFEQSELTFLGETKTVFHGGKGPAIVVIHEVPGLYPGVAEFGRKVIDSGFTVYMPSLLGIPGRQLSPGYSLQSIGSACVTREFTVWATRRGSPITDWLRALASWANKETGQHGVGVVGMCLTGGFALAMMVDDFVKAPVMSQPSLPFGITRAQKRDVGIDDATLWCAKRRAASGTEVMGLRFTKDRMVPTERFERLREELGEKFIAVEIDSSRGNPHGISPLAHSVLVQDFVDQPNHPTRKAFNQVLDFFHRKLDPSTEFTSG